VPSPADHAELVELLDRYLSGEHSRQLVGEIEGIVLQSFQDADWSDEVGTSLALYSPADYETQYVDDPELEGIFKDCAPGSKRSGSGCLPERWPSRAFTSLRRLCLLR
jgi:hypothetical protein